MTIMTRPPTLEEVRKAYRKAFLNHARPTPVLVSTLYRRLIRSPRYRRTGGVYLHESWMLVLARRWWGVRCE
jgi:hypothetical protein